MKIGIILSPYGTKHPSGLGRFILNLTLEIVRLAPEKNFVIFLRGAYDVKGFNHFKNVEFQFMADTVFWKDLAYLRNRDIDVWLYNNLGLPVLFTPKKSVAIALDFSSLYPDEENSSSRVFSVKVQDFLQRRAFIRATKVICISEATRNDLKKFYPNTNMDKVSVSMCGYTPPRESFTPKKVEDLPDDFYLLVGVIKPRKNQMTAVRAFIEAKEKGLSAHLVITGKGVGAYYKELMNIITDSNYKDSIHYIGYRSNEEMLFLYEKARALIVPSRVEGFGMPVLEAMSCGTPVITSSHPSLVEVGGGAAVVCDTTSVAEFAKAMNSLADNAIRQTYIQKGHEQAKKFSWEKSASEYLLAFKNLFQE